MSVPFSDITSQVFEELGVPTEQRDGRAFADVFFEELDGGGQTPWERAFARYFDERHLSLDAALAARRYVELELEAVQPAIPGLVPFVRGLTQQVPVGVLTRGIGHVQRAKLDKLGLAELLDDVVISHEEGAAKEDGSLFRVAEVRRPAEEFMYVSTHASDIRHATDAGWRGLLVERESLRDEVVGWLADHIPRASRTS